MTDQKPHPIDIVGNYLNACRPPVDANTAQVAAVIAAWNEIAKRIIDIDKPKSDA